MINSKLIVIGGMSSGAGVWGNYVRPVRIERPCAETVIASSMIASIGIAHGLYIFVLSHDLIQKVCTFMQIML
jgi:hypothetical protein